MLASLPLLVDPATEGRKIVIAMLIVGLVFVGVIALGQFSHWANQRRKKRRRELRRIR